MNRKQEKQQRKITVSRSLRKVASHFEKKWISDNQQYKEFDKNPESCFEEFHSQKNRVNGLLICLAIFIMSLTGVICTLGMITVFFRVSFNTGFWILIASVVMALISGFGIRHFIEEMWNNRLGTTTKKLARDWASIRKRILAQEDLMRAIDNDSKDYSISVERLLGVFHWLLSNRAEQVRKAEIEGKLWIKKKVRPTMSEIYDIGYELGLNQPKFETYFQNY